MAAFAEVMPVSMVKVRDPVLTPSATGVNVLRRCTPPGSSADVPATGQVVPTSPNLGTPVQYADERDSRAVRLAAAVAADQQLSCQGEDQGAMSGVGERDLRDVPPVACSFGSKARVGGEKVRSGTSAGVPAKEISAVLIAPFSLPVLLATCRTPLAVRDNC